MILRGKGWKLDTDKLVVALNTATANRVSKKEREIDLSVVVPLCFNFWESVFASRVDSHRSISWFAGALKRKDIEYVWQLALVGPKLLKKHKSEGFTHRRQAIEYFFWKEMGIGWETAHSFVLLIGPPKTE